MVTGSLGLPVLDIYKHPPLCGGLGGTDPNLDLSLPTSLKNEIHKQSPEGRFEHIPGARDVLHTCPVPSSSPFIRPWCLILRVPWCFHSTSHLLASQAGSCRALLRTLWLASGSLHHSLSPPFPLVPRPLHHGLLLHLGTAALGVAGPRYATAWLLGPGPELPVVPRRRTSRS